MSTSPDPNRRAVVVGGSLAALWALTACGSSGTAHPAAVSTEPAPQATPAKAQASTGPVVTPTPLPVTYAPVTTIPPAGHAIALTLDDGPDPVFTPQILDVLQRHNVPATFFAVGQRVAANPGLVRRMADEGHRIANHTWSHRRLGPLPDAEVHDEITRATDAIDAAAGRSQVAWFRAPNSDWSPVAMRTIASLGLRPLGWSVDPVDWSVPGTPHIVSTVLNGARPGAVILDHDGGGDRSQTVAALDIYLPRLLDQGYVFTTP